MDVNMKFLPALLLVFSISSAVAQESALWKVDNAASSTLVPAYAGQSSPFPKMAKITETVSATVTAEMEEAKRARMEALQKAEALLKSKDALKPELGLIQIGGRIEGQSGPKVLISNQWVGIGQKINIRLSRTAESQAAIENLRKYDSDAANSLEGKLAERLMREPFLQLTVDKIDKDKIYTQSKYGSYTLPVTVYQK